jgi:hypothetical protein
MRRGALLPQSGQQKPNDACRQIANEPGAVFVDFVGGDAIAGVGGTASVGVFKNLKTGSGGFFFTGGGGIGASVGATIQGGFYRSVADLQGVNANVSAAVPTAAGSLNFSPDGRLVGGSVGTGGKLGVAGTVTNTWLFGCSVGGH